MRIFSAHRFGFCLVATTTGMWLCAGPAQAQQIDTNPPLPNVMLLLDTSGSMERMINGNTPETDPNPNTPSGTNQCNCTDNGPDTAPTCRWTGGMPSPNRWSIVQQALTGSLPNGGGCVAMPRGSGATNTFGTEYQINGIAPYDANYYIPFHRQVMPDPNASGFTSLNPAACVVAPGGLDGASSNQGVGENAVGLGGNATGFTGGCASGKCTGSVVTREYGMLKTTNSVACTFGQNNDGALTQMKDLMRFGLMTFDTDPDPGVGVTTSNKVGPSPFLGQWSYYLPGWNSGGTCTYTGEPVNCPSPEMLAVGARNPAAPVWEGRMMGFPTTNDIATQETDNAQVAEVILGMRPYGATPLAGMFLAAQNYFWNDPTGPNATAPAGDPFAQGGCRPEFIILLTDGAPNLDLQPSCSATGAEGGTAGKCPFPLPQTTAATLYNNGAPSSGNPSIKTFVIGFAVSSFVDNTTPVKCSDFAKGGSQASQCNCNDPTLPQQQPYGPCCELQCIAQSGGSNAAYFADTQGDLNNALGAILGSIAANATTRTTPSYSPVISSSIANTTSSTTAASVYLSSMTPALNKPWSGDIQRQEMQCSYNGTTYNVTPSIQTTSGDDFSSNVNSTSGPARTFIAFEPATANSQVDATATIRPYASATTGDGLGQYTATMYSGAAASILNNVDAAALAIPAAGCPYVSNVFGAGQKYLTPAQCANMLLDYTFAQPTYSGPSDFTFQSRSGNALGDIFHANPTVVGPPGSLLQDALYVQFQQAWGPNSTTQTSSWSVSTKGRKSVVYAATNDGLLHAFWADETKLENNEMLAMLPPAVMPHLLASYPSSHEFLLDGSPIVKDVVWDRTGSTSASSVWHTTLVAGFGPYAQGYYAVDVTNPDPSGLANGSVPTENAGAPTFLWQLTKLPSSTYQLFGSQSATPAVTTLFVDPGDGQGARDIGVAILPGGQNGPATTYSGHGVGCTRAAKASDSAPATSYTYRSSVRCWGASTPTPLATDPVVGRSVSIVRLDTGEVLATFARKNDFGTSDPLYVAKRYIDTPLDSPMTGTPLVFPLDVGADATRFFVGDADGTIWKFDVSSSDRTKWTGELFLDLYNGTVDPQPTSWADGQPFDVQPVLALDTAGELVINAATGTTQTFDSSGLQFVYSITEKVQGSPAKLRASVNWWLGPVGFNGAQYGFQAGERVSGPMTVFNGTLYFSTYAAPAASSATCSSGVASLWGRDFVRPDVTTDLSQGGKRILQPPAPATPTNPPPVSVQPTVAPGAVIPGVSIMGTPACSGLGAAGSDQYVAGATHQSPSNFTPGSFSIFTQVGAKGTGAAATQQLQIPVQTPVAPTSIDSWAAVLE